MVITHGDHKMLPLTHIQKWDRHGWYST